MMMRRMSKVWWLPILAACTLQVEPIPPQTHARLAMEERQQLFADTALPIGPLTLHEAMARAVTYNQEARLRLMEEVLAQRLHRVSQFSLLPKLTAQAGYQGRSSDAGSVSESLATGRVSLEASKSRDREVVDGSLTLSWNILDLGVSYYHSKQEGDRTLIARERRRKVLHTLMRQVRASYWKAYVAQSLGPSLDAVTRETEKALKQSRVSEQERLQDPLTTLEYQRELLEILERMEGVRAELSVAARELPALLGLPPGTRLQLTDPQEGPQGVDWPVDQLEHLALTLRPELREARLEDRITRHEVRKNLARLLPGIELDVAGRYDGNSYLINQHWSELGARITWNLLGLLALPAQLEHAESLRESTHVRKLTAAMAVLGQLHLSLHRYRIAVERFERMATLDAVTQRLQIHLKRRAADNSRGRLDHIRGSAQAVTTHLRLENARAGVNDALGEIFSSLGLDPLPDAVDAADLATLTQAIRTADGRWRRGDFPFPTPLEEDETGPKNKATLSPAIASPRDQVLETLEGWRLAWQSADLDAYLAHYASDFIPEGGSKREHWQARRRAIITAAKHPSVTIQEVEFTLLEGDKARVTFTQIYRSDHFRDRTRKGLIMHKEAEGWRIQREWGL